MLFAGFLGSGKTTLIMRMLPALAAGGDVVVIENELGEVSIDAHALAAATPRVVELTGGCVCCTLAGDIRSELARVAARYKPSAILLETSGVARVSEVKFALAQPDVLARCDVAPAVVCVDVARAERYLDQLGDFYRDQIAGADALVLTREEGLSREKRDAALGRLRVINPRAALFGSSGAEMPGALLAWLEAENAASPDVRRGAGVRKIGQSLTARTREVHAVLSRGEIEAALASLDTIAGLYRFKGVLNAEGGCVLAQWTPGGWSLSSAAPRRAGAVVAIGDKAAAERAVSPAQLGF